jgi:hypothetical protein
MLLASAAAADAPLGNTHLLDVRQGSARSEVARRVARGGYELADGTAVEFARWYRPAWPDINVDFLTQVHRDVGIIWGFGTGEYGAKYRISPGLRLGAAVARPIGERASISLTAVAQFGSDLTERPCIADYGDIGGVQRVNCRLAASPLEPKETLRHNLRMNGWGDTRVSLRYDLRF